MSLESFDKFCEKMILGEPKSEKEVFDERQNQIRAQITTESLFVCIILSALLVLINEIASWCDGMFVLIVLACAAGYLWWVVRNAVKGSLFGVKGSGTFWTAVLMVIECAYCSISFIDSEKPFLFKDGVLTTNFVVLVAIGLILASSIIVFVSDARRKKAIKDTAE